MSEGREPREERTPGEETSPREERSTGEQTSREAETFPGESEEQIPPGEGAVSEEQTSPGEGAVSEDGAAGAGGSGQGGLPGDEDALRHLLQASVRGLDPSPESLDRTLDHLRHAVPARRAHRRQAMVGGVAAALVAAVGVPALFYGGVVPGGGDDDHPVTAASTHGQTRGPEAGTGSGGGKGGEEHGGGRERDEDEGEKGGGSAHPSPSGTGSSGPGPDETLSASAPVCGSDQLGRGSARSGAPDGAGTIYGSFRVSNVSSGACTVEGEGFVGASVQGGARGRVTVVDHTSGDAAPGLGDPAVARDEVVLQPGQAYVVKFAFVPGGGCGGGTPTPQGGRYEGDPSGGPDASPGDGGQANGGGDGSGGGTGTPGEGDGGGGDPGGSGSDVVVSHTPEGGAPIANTRLADTCAGGTLYRTGVIPQS
ncbi:DUF4232 domain-containing protein [Streptomyces reniochalinae]|uniref:DUF4232 domain-containing protein n=1 Tax=Streptomyces reniochalinae TaxID=2250578 RepID=UPI001FE4FBBF|nr:DUF4232 domain-containing protein [Streptomyces reniochalinae]